MGAWMWFSLVPLAIGVALQLGFTPLHKGSAELPPHLLHHHLLGVPDMLDAQTSAGNDPLTSIGLCGFSFRGGFGVSTYPPC